MRHPAVGQTATFEAVASATRWSDLTGRQRAAVVVLALAEFGLTAVAAGDLYRRPAAQVRGPKTLWWLGMFVQPVGPVGYLALGRREPDDDPGRPPRIPVAADRRLPARTP